MKTKKSCDENAALAAGYSPSSAASVASKKQNKAQVMSAQENVSLLTVAARGEMTEDCVMLVRDGCGKVQIVHEEKRISIKERLKALELLGKINGLFTDKIEVTQETPIIIVGEDSLME